VIAQLLVNDLVTWVGEKILPVQVPAVCSKARDLLKTRAPWAELATNLELCSAGDAALATALTTGEGMEAMLSMLDMATSSKLPQRFAETSEPAQALVHDTAFAVSANHWNSPTLRSSVRQDARSGAKGEQLGDDANRRQFQAALLENCSFFAELVLRQVRGEGDLWRESLERSSSRKQLNVLRVSPTPPGSKADVVPGQRPETETPSSLLPILWIEVGCHAARRLSLPKRSAHEYGEDPKPAL
jgi:hypothetical protein